MKQLSFSRLQNRLRFGYQKLTYQEVEARHQACTEKGGAALRTADKLSLAGRHFKHAFLDQFKVVAPISLYLIFVQIIFFQNSVEQLALVATALLLVCFGLMLFMDGLQHGLMPFAESIGRGLLTRVSFMVVMAIVFSIGVATTFSEPAIGALKTAGSIVDMNKAPYLYALLNAHSLGLMLVVGVGVGLAAAIGVVRFIYGWSLKPLIFCLLVPGLTLTVMSLYIPSLHDIYSLAWDCGAVTTGPVTVPIILALGVGISAVSGSSDSSLSGFGIVTLASLMPVIAVILYCLILFHGLSGQEVIASLSTVTSSSAPLPFYSRSPVIDMIMGVRAVVPLIVLLALVFYFILRQRMSDASRLAYGLIAAILGIVIFNVGLAYGLSEMGSQIGRVAPSAYTLVAHVPHSPIYIYEIGLAVVFLFLFFLGFGATVAEPALNALGITVESLTNGVMRKKTLIFSVAGGVGVGLFIGAMKIIFSIELAYLVIPLYAVALLLTLFSTEEVVNVAWDSAGVTTGPITVPLVLSCGLGFSLSAQSLDGFGLLAMASVCPIIAVLSSALLARYRANQYLKEEE